jgi:hypothetical protein
MGGSIINYYFKEVCNSNLLEKGPYTKPTKSLHSILKDKQIVLEYPKTYFSKLHGKESAFMFEYRIDYCLQKGWHLNVRTGSNLENNNHIYFSESDNYMFDVVKKLESMKDNIENIFELFAINSTTPKCEKCKNASG